MIRISASNKHRLLPVSTKKQYNSNPQKSSKSPSFTSFHSLNRLFFLPPPHFPSLWHQQFLLSLRDHCAWQWAQVVLMKMTVPTPTPEMGMWLRACACDPSLSNGTRSREGTRTSGKKRKPLPLGEAELWDWDLGLLLASPRHLSNV